MLKKIKNSISNPKLIFMNLKDSWKYIFGYIFLMTFILTIPAILASIVNQNMFFVNNTKIASGINENFINKNIKIENGILQNNNMNVAFGIGDHVFVIGDIPITASGYITVFDYDKITFYLSAGSNINIKLASKNYQELNLMNLEFEVNNTNLLVAKTKEVMTLKKNVVIPLKILGIYFSYFVDYLLITLTLAVVAMLFKKAPLDFSGHYKINTYVMTSWTITNLILILFGLTSLYYLSIIIAYIYQVITYRSVRAIKVIIPKDRNNE